MVKCEVNLVFKEGVDLVLGVPASFSFLGVVIVMLAILSCTAGDCRSIGSWFSSLCTSMSLEDLLDLVP